MKRDNVNNEGVVTLVDIIGRGDDTYKPTRTHMFAELGKGEKLVQEEVDNIGHVVLSEEVLKILHTLVGASLVVFILQSTA